MIESCRDGSHLKNCKDFSCPGMFKCNNTYCIPVRKRCNGIQDCPHGEDESNCQNTTCEVGFFRCRNESFCIDQKEVCDGRVHCKTSFDDEKLCKVKICPSVCNCFGYTIGCLNANLSTLEAVDKAVRFLNVSQNEFHIIDKGILKGFYYLAWLDISHSKIVDLKPFSFEQTPNLLHLDISYNMLTRIPAKTFSGLTRLKMLILSNNRLMELHQGSFDFGFKGPHLIYLLELNLEHNSLSVIDPGAFDHMTVKRLKTDKFAICCAALSCCCDAIR